MKYKLLLILLITTEVIISQQIEYEKVRPFVNEKSYEFNAYHSNITNYLIPKEINIKGYKKITRNLIDYRSAYNYYKKHTILNVDAYEKTKTYFKYVDDKLTEAYLGGTSKKIFYYFGDKLSSIEYFVKQNSEGKMEHIVQYLFSKGNNETYKGYANINVPHKRNTFQSYTLGVDTYSNYYIDTKTNKVLIEYTETKEDIYEKKRLKKVTLVNKNMPHINWSRIYNYEKLGTKIIVDVVDNRPNSKYGMTIILDENERIIEKGIYDKSKTLNNNKFYIINNKVDYQSSIVVIKEYINAYKFDITNKLSKQFILLKDNFKQNIFFQKGTALMGGDIVESSISENLIETELLSEEGFLDGDRTYKIDYFYNRNSEDVLTDIQGVITYGKEGNNFSGLIYYYKLIME